MTEIQSIRLSDLTSIITHTLKETFENKTFWVIADITNHNYKSAEDRHFFTLAEKQKEQIQLLLKPKLAG
jgi:exodeoxyribonuclease VII large subunit